MCPSPLQGLLRIRQVEFLILPLITSETENLLLRYSYLYLRDLGNVFPSLRLKQLTKILNAKWCFFIHFYYLKNMILIVIHLCGWLTRKL